MPRIIALLSQCLDEDPVPAELGPVNPDYPAISSKLRDKHTLVYDGLGDLGTFRNQNVLNLE